MKIAFIGQGNSLHFWRRTNWYAKQGHRILVLSYLWSYMPKYDPSVRLRTFPFEMRDKDPLGILDWMKKEVQKFTPDILHVHKCDYPGVFGLFLNFSPMVFTLWDGVHVRDPRISHASKKLINTAGKKADLFTCNSPILLEECIDRGVPRHKTALTSWGVNQNLFNLDFKKNKTRISAIKKRFGIKQGVRVVFSPRVLLNFSNIDIIIRAVDEIVEKSSEPVKFLFAAYAQNADGIFSFGQMLNAIQNRDKIFWCGHIKDERELCAYYQLSDTVISLYSGYLESSPASIIESMMCGAVPVVADLPVIHFWVDNGINGVITSPRDKDGVVAGVLKALDMKKNRPALAQENFNKAITHADYEQTMPMMENKPARFHATNTYQDYYEKGLLLDIFNKKDAALCLYRMAERVDPSSEVTMSIEKCKRERKSKIPYINRKARKIHGNPHAMENLEPVPSGDMREYVWAAPLQQKKDIPNLHSWIEILAKKFNYDENYLTLIYFEKVSPRFKNLIFLYLKKYRPLHLGLVNLYLEMTNKMESAGEIEEVVDYYKLILKSWQGFDPMFKENIPEMPTTIAEVCYRLGVLHLLEYNDRQLSGKYFSEALQLDPEHRMAQHIMNLSHSDTCQ